MGSNWNMYDEDTESWMAALISITTVQTCPQTEAYPQYRYVCGGGANPVIAVDGKYELQNDYINRYPYYKFVGDGQPKTETEKQGTSKKDLSIYWNSDTKNWVISTKLMMDYGLFAIQADHKGQLPEKGWKVAPTKLYLFVRDR